jgi:hypothetical protein
MAFVNETGLLGVALESFTTYVSGSVFITLLAVLILVIGLFIMFRIPLEAVLVLVMPMIIIFMAWEVGGFLAVGGVFIMILAIIVAKNWLVR